VRLLDNSTRRLLGLKYKLLCCLELAVDIVGGGIREFLNDADRPVFLERELMGFSVSELKTVQVDRCPLIHFKSI
jgi:hypothetical protein